jgi:hypothetical protein
MVNPAGTAEMWTFRKLGLNTISTEKAIISTQKEISCPRHLTRASLPASLIDRPSSGKFKSVDRRHFSDRTNMRHQHSGTSAYCSEPAACLCTYHNAPQSKPTDSSGAHHTCWPESCCLCSFSLSTLLGHRQPIISTIETIVSRIQEHAIGH